MGHFKGKNTTRIMSTKTTTPQVVTTPKRTSPYCNDMPDTPVASKNKRRRIESPELQEEPPMIIDIDRSLFSPILEITTTTTTPKDFYTVSPSFTNQHDIFRSPKNSFKARRTNDSIRDIEDMLVLRMANPI